jgi:hypothetical protein
VVVESVPHHKPHRNSKLGFGSGIDQDFVFPRRIGDEQAVFPLQGARKHLWQPELNLFVGYCQTCHPLELNSRQLMGWT